MSLSFHLFCLLQRLFGPCFTLSYLLLLDFIWVYSVRWDYFISNHIVTPFPSLLSVLWKAAVSSPQFSYGAVPLLCGLLAIPAPKPRMLYYCNCIPLLHLVTQVSSPFIFYFSQLLFFFQVNLRFILSTHNGKKKPKVLLEILIKITFNYRFS